MIVRGVGEGGGGDFCVFVLLAVGFCGGVHVFDDVGDGFIIDVNCLEGCEWSECAMHCLSAHL